MKVFISQPMNGKSDRMIREERKRVAVLCERNGLEVIDSVFDMGPGSAIKYLAKSIELIDDADRVIMMKGWERSRGCRIEHEVAVAYGREVVYE